MPKLPVYFIRHNWSKIKRNNIINELFENRKIAIHFDNKGVDVSAYNERGAKIALNNLKNASNSDCIIVASYENKDKIIIGKPKKGHIILENRYSDDNKELIELKTIQLENYFEIKPEDVPLLSVLQPPFATMVQWHMGKIAVNSYFEYLKSGEKGPKPVSLKLMSGWHCEILCEEWLRLKKLLKYKLFHTGKSMKHFDIIGKFLDGKLLLAQVKFESTETQFKDFCTHCNDSLSEGKYIYYFTSRESISSFNSKTLQGINLISLDEVYDEMYISKTLQGINLVSLDEVYDEMYTKDPDFIRSLIYS